MRSLRAITLAFAGLLRRHGLARGSYLLVATPSAGRHRGRVASARFTIS
jgi:hypothetical protein